jgi:hypothetical protein
MEKRKMKEKKKKPETDIKLKEVQKVWGRIEAEVVKSFLESNGIPCILRGETVQSLYGISVDGLGEMKVLVSEKDYDLAKKLLKSRKI